jgi:hypothetical protein
VKVPREGGEIHDEQRDKNPETAGCAQTDSDSDAEQGFHIDLHFVSEREEGSLCEFCQTHSSIAAPVHNEVY